MTPFAIADFLGPRAGELESELVSDFLAGRISRRLLLRRGSVLGIAAPLLGIIAATKNAEAAPAGKPDTTIRVACMVPTGAIDPVTIADAGGLLMLQQVAEFLVFDRPDLRLVPMLATSWESNKDGSVWMFHLRQGVKFHSGRIMTADDVIASIERLVDPKNASTALSVFKGLLGPGDTEKIDDATIAFHLETPNGNFPYYVSSDTYNAIILPKEYAGDFEKTWDGTGPFRIEKYTRGVGASFLRNPDWWGGRVLPKRTEFAFYASQQPQVLALRDHAVDVVNQVVVQGAQGIIADPEFTIIKLPSAIHREVHMRCDVPPFNDKRIRRAMALTLDRPAIITGLFRGLADLGNDSPFAPVYPSTNTSVPQRAQNLAEARALMAAAGSKGFTVTLTTEQLLEMPDFAVIIQNAAKAIGVKVNLKIEPQAAYYGKAIPGQSDWLDSPFGMTDYGHRGVPNVLLTAPLTSNGAWNAAHFRNSHYDALVRDFTAAVALSDQRRIAGEIETLLLDETPIIFAYFYNYLTATQKTVSGLQPTANSQLFLQAASAG